MKIGDRIGRLLITKLLPNRRVEARCDCGTLKIYRRGNLRIGGTLSCGCFHQDRTREVSTTHGMTNTPTYQTWLRMRRRCDNRRDLHHWRYYGGAGITVCRRWSKFEAFLADMGTRPEDYSLDRIDPRKGYFPKNCRWLPRADQMRNTTRNRILTIDGESRCLSEWSRISGVNHQTIAARLKSGWGTKDAVFHAVLRLTSTGA